MENIFNLNLLKDKVIVISGGTKGVGKELVKACVKHGAKVVFSGRDKVAAEEIIDNLSENKQNCKFVYADLQKVSDCKNIFKKTVEYYNKVDGFVNYAGITPVASLTDCDEETFDNVINTNFKAAFFCCGEAIKLMKTNCGGSIVLVGSAHSWNGEIDRAIYACSKGALYTLSEHISHNYAIDNIKCNFLTMGWTPTEGEITLRKAQNSDIEKFKTDAAKEIPMGRMGCPDDYIPEILLLLSDYTSIMTGSNVRITGGQYI